MSKLIFVDSFDHYVDSQIGRKWTSGGDFIISADGEGRTQKCGIIGALGPSKTFDDEYTTIAIGAAYNTSHLENSPFIVGNIATGVQAELHHVGDGRFMFVATGASPTHLSSFVMSAEKWYYLEFKVTMGVSGEVGSTGVVSYNMEARVNEDIILNETISGDVHISTMLSAHPQFSSFALSGPGGGVKAKYDDLYVTDGEYLGDIRIAVLYPSGAGTHADWTPNVLGGHNYAMVDEHIADDDTTVVTSATVGDIDKYALENIDTSFVGVIRGIQALWLIKKSDMGLASVKGMLNDHLQDHDFYPSALNYLYDIEPERKSVFTSSDWTVAEINDMELGIKRTA